MVPCQVACWMQGLAQLKLKLRMAWKVLVVLRSPLLQVFPVRSPWVSFLFWVTILTTLLLCQPVSTTRANLLLLRFSVGMGLT